LPSHAGIDYPKAVHFSVLGSAAATTVKPDFRTSRP
jgi:hypothetical protein